MAFDGSASVLRIAFSPQLRADFIQIKNAILDCVIIIWNFMKSGILVKRILTFPSLMSAHTNKTGSKYDDNIMTQMTPISNR